MYRIFLSAIFLTVGAVACSGTSPPSETTDDAQTSEQAASRARGSAPACGKTGAGCTKETDCCAGSCEWDSYGPTPSHCQAPAADGGYCTSNRGCTSGNCDQYQCKAATPPPWHPAGSACTTSADCCSSTFCDTNTYGPWKCVPRRVSGGWCMDGTECASGSCVSYVCK
jgi:hypothetical protein